MFSCGTWVKGSGCASGIRSCQKSITVLYLSVLEYQKQRAVSAIGSFNLLLFPTVGDDTGYGEGIYASWYYREEKWGLWSLAKSRYRDGYACLNSKTRY
jgi:hypothetical protein